MTDGDAERVLELTKHLIRLDTAGSGEDTAAAVIAPCCSGPGLTSR